MRAAAPGLEDVAAEEEKASSVPVNPSVASKTQEITDEAEAAAKPSIGQEAKGLEGHNDNTAYAKKEVVPKAVLTTTPGISQTQGRAVMPEAISELRETAEA